MTTDNPDKPTMGRTGLPAAQRDILALAADIVSAHVANNPVTAAELPALIREVHKTLSALGSAEAAGAGGVRAEQQPAVPVKKSVTPDYIICLEDGKKLKMLKRHLKTAYGMTPDEYREKWGLPADYPMVAPNYARRRSSLAREIGLGTAGRGGGRGKTGPKTEE